MKHVGQINRQSPERNQSRTYRLAALKLRSWLSRTFSWRGVVWLVSSFASLAAAQDCSEPLIFEHVSPPVMTCLRQTMPQHGMSLPGGNAGPFNGPADAIGQYAWVPESAILTLELMRLPSTVPCAKAVSDIRDFADACRKTNTVVQVSMPDIVIWRIDSPDVRTKEVRYSQVVLRPRDVVTVSAGGCVKTRGPGQSWRQYVNPQGDSAHYGMIRLPGMKHSEKLKDFLRTPTYYVPADANHDSALYLGYQDSDYSGNGYWGRDPGPHDECANQPNAWVQLTVKRDPP
jgi:hypothetical protein